MEIEIQWGLIAGVSIGVFVLGALWFSVLFGKIWMKIMGAEKHSKEELEKMNKEMGKFYALEFLLTFLVMYALYMNVKLWEEPSAFAPAFWLWFGFVMPVTVSNIIWGNTEKKYWLKQILISTSFRLVSMLGAGYTFFMF